MKLKKYALGLIVLLFAACGQQYDAESLVKDFMDEYLKDVGSLSSIDFERIDSTTRINDSIINNMKQFTAKSGRYKQDLKFSPKSDSENTLIILRVEYKQNNEIYSDTYYLNKELTKVIAIKTN